MKALVLAAGYGTRLRPLTEHTPKPLLQVGGRPILVWNLLLLKQHGLTDVIINLHYLGEQVIEALGDGSRYGMRVVYSHEPHILGTGGGIKQATAYLQEEPFVVMNGDTLSDCNLTALIAAHRAVGGVATLALREDAHAHEWGAVVTDTSGRILQIKGEPKDAASSPGPLLPYMFAGIHVLEPVLLHDIPPGPGSIIDVYIDVLRRGGRLQGYRMTGYWSDIGSPERYAAAQQEAQGRLQQLEKGDSHSSAEAKRKDRT